MSEWGNAGLDHMPPKIAKKRNILGMKITIEMIRAATAFFSPLFMATMASTNAMGQRTMPKQNKPMQDSTILMVARLLSWATMVGELTEELAGWATITGSLVLARPVPQFRQTAWFSAHWFPQLLQKLLSIDWQ